MKLTGNRAYPVLLVDDEEQNNIMTSLMLQEAGVMDIVSMSDSRQVMPYLSREHVSLVILDLMMPHLSGRELLAEIRREHPDVTVVLVTGLYDLETAVECMKLGAHDYLVKPLQGSRLVGCVRNALSMDALQGEVASLKKRLLDGTLDQPSVFSEIRTCSKKMRSVFQYTEIVARSRQPILITGETGVGKEMIARAIHQLSGLNGEMVSVNVAGFDDAMVSDALFGHKKGAFTGAEQARDGLISRAAGGTIFLDEIGDLNEASQVKLLRLLQEGEYYPVGADVIKRSNARIIVATNRNLDEQISQNRFRRDLYYRLCSHQVHIPPLHERREDIPLLVSHFCKEAAQAFGKPVPKISVEALTHLFNCHFPGNVRELKGKVFDAVARHESGSLTVEDFGPFRGETSGAGDDGVPKVFRENNLFSFFDHFPTIFDVQNYMIDEALKLSENNLNVAASLLGVTRQTIVNRLKARK